MESIDENAKRNLHHEGLSPQTDWIGNADDDGIENRAFAENISTDQDRIFDGMGSSNHMIKTEQSFEEDLAYFPGS